MGTPDSQPSDRDASGAPLSGRTRTLLGSIGILIFFTVAFGAYQAVTKPRGEPALRVPRMTMLTEPRALPPLDMRDAEGKPVPIATFRGKVVLLNVWATWCGPCRTEMPALERLQAKLGGPYFEVVALSTDVGGVPVVREFYESLNLTRLVIYVEGEGNVLTALGVPGLPTTLLLDTEGRELGRYPGAADWESEEFARILRPYLERARAGNKG